MEEPPLNAAHAYASQAEEYAAKGQVAKAAEAHRKAAENYLKAQENTENPEALQVLSLLHAQHLSKYQHYSSLPKPTNTPATQQPPRQRPRQPSRQRSLPKAFHSVTSSTASIASTLAQARAPPLREDGSLLLIQPHHHRQRYHPPPAPQSASSQSSQESNSPTNSTTSSDPFDKFYTSLQEMLSRLSHPLAFATAPLDGTIPEYGGESFFLVGDEARNAPGMGDTMVPVTRSMAGTMLQPPPPPRENRKTIEEYEMENRHLKVALDQLSRKLYSYKETAKSSSSLLKNSMAHLRAAREQPTGRIKELEEEVKRLKMENAKVKADLDRAQRRWERLKEGARRKRRPDGMNGVSGEEPATIPEVVEEKE